MKQQRELSITVQPIPAGFGIEKRRSHPEQTVIAALPALDTPADGLYDGKAGLDSVGAAEGTAQTSMHMEFVQSQGLFEAFQQARSGTRVQLVQLIMQPVEWLPCVDSVGLCIS